MQKHVLTQLYHLPEPLEQILDMEEIVIGLTIILAVIGNILFLAGSRLVVMEINLP